MGTLGGRRRRDRRRYRRRVGGGGRRRRCCGGGPCRQWGGRVAACTPMGVTSSAGDSNRGELPPRQRRRRRRHGRRRPPWSAAAAAATYPVGLCGGGGHTARARGRVWRLSAAAVAAAVVASAQQRRSSLPARGACVSRCVWPRVCLAPGARRGRCLRDTTPAVVAAATAASAGWCVRACRRAAKPPRWRSRPRRARGAAPALPDPWSPQHWVARGRPLIVQPRAAMRTHTLQRRRCVGKRPRGWGGGADRRDQSAPPLFHCLV